MQLRPRGWICALAFGWASTLCLDAAAFTAAQPADGPAAQWVKSEDAPGRWRVTTAFTSLSGDPLHISFAVDPVAADDSMRHFGIAQREVEALADTCRATPRCTQADLDAAVLRYYREHHLRLALAPGRRPTLSVDIPDVVRRNRTAVQPVASALRQLASDRGAGPEWALEAAVALVQGGLAYGAPSPSENGRQTLGFYTPARALEQGFGDCDTKSALLAALLADLGEQRIIGVRMSGHYLLGLDRAPRTGDAFVEYGGRRYVLVEAAGPAQRPPGRVSERTRTALARGEPLRFDPI